MRRIAVVMILAALIQTVFAGSDSPKVQTKKLAEGHFELSVTLLDTTDPQAALQELMPEATKLCGSRSPQFGKYRFASDAPLANADTTGSTSVTLVQQVECGEDKNELSETMSTQNLGPRKPPGPTDEEIIRARTLDYLAAKDRGDFDIALAMLASPTQALMTKSSWRAPRATFNAAAGSPTKREVVRITWYDNPSGVPPGRYAAADYRASYKSAAFYCGYVAWLEQPDGSYLIVREEEGQLTPTEAGKVTPGQMAAVRMQLGCRD